MDSNKTNEKEEGEDFMLDILSVEAKHRYLRLKEFNKEQALKIRGHYKNLFDAKKIRYLITEEEFIQTAKGLSDKPTLNIRRRGGLGL